MSGAGPETSKTWVIRGRELVPDDIEMARRLAEEFFDYGRCRIAYELAQHWQWRSRNGGLKLRATFAILLGLQERGCLRLPAPWMVHGPVRGHGEQELTLENTAEETDALRNYRPFQWQVVDTAQARRKWRGVLAQYHYLGVPGLVGAQLKYLVHSRQGELIGALGWQSAVERLDCRDRLAGLEGQPELRAEFLAHAVNNVRFLILPWWRVRHLPSAVLGEGLARLQMDWPKRYGARVWLVESFIDRRRFSGASYRGANWVALGWSRGYAKRRGEFIYHGESKEIYIHVIEPRIRQLLLQDPAQALLTREFLLAQRPPGNPPPPQTKRKQMSEDLQSWTPKALGKWEMTAEDLQTLAPDLGEFIAEFDGTFQRIEPIGSCQLYVQGLLSNTGRKNAEAMALELKGPGSVRKLQRFVSDCKWDEKFMRKKHWRLCAESLADKEGVWSIDASEFAKKGKDSVGVAPQYCGALGKTANCQSGVFICYSSPNGHALLDGGLYLPQCWFTENYKERREKCRVPENITFKTKLEIALGLFTRLKRNRLFPGQWVTCDASFGNNNEFLEGLPKELYYLADISATRKVWLKHSPEHPELESQGCTVEQLVETKGLLQWRSRKIAEGEKGPIVAAFARVRVYVDEKRTPESERTLWMRNDPSGKIKYALSNAPESTGFDEMVRVSGARWPIERCFEENKSELGMDHYEHRSWAAWHRHMRLVFLAQLFLVRLRLKYKKSPGADVAPGADATGT